MSETTTLDDIETMFWRALESNVGVEVSANDTELFKRRAYQVRKRRTEFKSVSICQSPTDVDKLWLIQKGEE